MFVSCQVRPRKKSEIFFVGHESFFKYFTGNLPVMFKVCNFFRICFRLQKGQNASQFMYVTGKKIKFQENCKVHSQKLAWKSLQKLSESLKTSVLEHAQFHGLISRLHVKIS